MLADIATVLPAATIVADRDLVAPRETDWRRRFAGHAPAILVLASVDEVQVIVRAAARYGVALAVEGASGASAIRCRMRSVRSVPPSTTSPCPSMRCPPS